MSARENGGPAFPQHVAPAYRQEPEIWGMTLRDYFAAKAMVAIAQQAPDSQELVEAIDALALAAYQVADAMLAERSKA